MTDTDTAPSAELVATGLTKMREPFPKSAISRLPKPTKAQTEQVKSDFRKGIRCQECGGWHHKDVAHLDYVGHAALTDRLLSCDPEWNWAPLTYAEDKTPGLDKDGGMWITLTVCGVTRLGYGDADGKTGGNAVKERIGDALRNAAMRFGAALDLWSKSDLHATEVEDDNDGNEPTAPAFDIEAWADAIRDSSTAEELSKVSAELAKAKVPKSAMAVLGPIGKKKRAEFAK